MRPDAQPSGFRLLATGGDALVARVKLIEQAQRTLDLQYYIFHADQTGCLIVDRLLAAADRGVHVRLLVDDWGTLERNAAAVALVDGHPRIEIRLFNPFIGRTGVRRWHEWLTRFGRVSKRMHNKQLIADGEWAVLGGRNIGDEYFGLGALDFQDLDVLASGDIAGECSASFEAFWNSTYARPVAAFGGHDERAGVPDTLRAALRERLARLRGSDFARELLASPLAVAFRDKSVELIRAQGTLLADPPGKVGQRDLATRLVEHVAATRSELLVMSAYFVPGKRGTTLFAQQANQGVRVGVLTNSLAATDVWPVHAGYRRYRRALLEQGVEVYELKALSRALPATLRVGSSRASLHAKTFAFDRASVFIGSANLDMRSFAHNTEVGALIHCPELAGQVAALFARWTDPLLAYQVRLVRDGGRARLRWVSSEDGRPMDFSDEPGTAWWLRAATIALSLMPIESQL